MYFLRIQMTQAQSNLEGNIIFFKSTYRKTMKEYQI